MGGSLSRFPPNLVLLCRYWSYCIFFSSVLFMTRVFISNIFFKLPVEPWRDLKLLSSVLSQYLWEARSVNHLRLLKSHWMLYLMTGDSIMIIFQFWYFGFIHVIWAQAHTMLNGDRQFYPLRFLLTVSSTKFGIHWKPLLQLVLALQPWNLLMFWLKILFFHVCGL